MILGTVLLLLLAAAALVFVMAPRFGRAQRDTEERDQTSHGSLRELHARQQMLLAALKDLEDDRATDKLGDSDYEELKQRLSTEAIEAMRVVDAAEYEREQGLEREREAARPLRYPGAKRSGPAP